eukprot:TRINITY_DN3510_c0_g1_i1.p1 TRINITY_DN3510_c0_g1~~TRINITY_DN3510_c0_g1_i1.p1  ORF type:complete len:185 (-),score=47.40 TRINITY_DN3510_c0_g1_i1:72-626(-)
MAFQNPGATAAPPAEPLTSQQPQQTATPLYYESGPTEVQFQPTQFQPSPAYKVAPEQYTSSTYGVAAPVPAPAPAQYQHYQYVLPAAPSMMATPQYMPATTTTMAPSPDRSQGRLPTLLGAFAPRPQVDHSKGRFFKPGETIPAGYVLASPPPEKEKEAAELGEAETPMVKKDGGLLSRCCSGC